MAPRIVAAIILVVIYVATKLFHADWVIYTLLGLVVAGAIIDYYWLGGKFVGGTYKDGEK